MNDLLHALSSHPVFSGGLALMVAGSLVAWLRRLPSMGIAWVRRRLIYTVEVHDREQCFAWFQRWLAEREESKLARDLTVKAHWGNIGPDPPAYAGQATGDYDPEPKAKLLLTPAPGTQVIRYHGRPMAITRTRREAMVNGGSAGFQESITFRFFGAGRETIDALLAEVLAFGDEKPKGVQLYTAMGDSWRTGAVLAKRCPASLALADGLLTDIFADIRQFLASARWYADRGIPHRRGYLLHGPPGTGKTTLTPVVAGELGLSVATLSLGDPGVCDAQLRGLFENLGRGVMVVIEDIDCVFRQREAASDKIGVTLAGLLNVLDGIGSKEGRIIFLTTNHPERLDPALIRPGRIDRKIELGYATPDQARRMFLWFFKGHAFGEETLGRLADDFAARIGDGVAPAAIQEHLLQNRDDPKEAAETFGVESDSGKNSQVVDLPAAIDARMNGHAPVSRP